MCTKVVNCSSASLGVLHGRGESMARSTTMHRTEGVAVAARHAGLGNGHVMLQHEMITAIANDHFSIAELLKTIKPYMHLSFYAIALLCSELRAACAAQPGSPPFVVCLTGRAIECATEHVQDMLAQGRISRFVQPERDGSARSHYTRGRQLFALEVRQG